MVANIWKNSLKKVESDKKKILYETLLDFLQRNGTYCLNILLNYHYKIIFKIKTKWVVEI